MNIGLDSTVNCADGVAGRSHALVFNPATRIASHFVMLTKGRAHDEYLVPLDLVETGTSRDGILLNCTYEDLDKLQPFMAMVRADTPGMTEVGAEGLMYAEMQRGLTGSDMSYAEVSSPGYVEAEAIPASELAIRFETPVHATDDTVGTVDEFFVNKDSGEVTHMILKEGHLWRKRHVIVPLDDVDRFGEEGIYLKLSKDSLEDLPKVK